VSMKCADPAAGCGIIALQLHPASRYVEIPATVYLGNMRLLRVVRTFNPEMGGPCESVRMFARARLWQGASRMCSLRMERWTPISKTGIRSSI